jgi:hypothetical protein
MFTDTSKVNTIPQNLALIPNKLLGRQQKRPVFLGGVGCKWRRVHRSKLGMGGKDSGSSLPHSPNTVCLVQQRLDEC